MTSAVNVVIGHANPNYSFRLFPSTMSNTTKPVSSEDIVGQKVLASFPCLYSLCYVLRTRRESFHWFIGSRFNNMLNLYIFLVRPLLYVVLCLLLVHSTKLTEPFSFLLQSQLMFILQRSHAGCILPGHLVMENSIMMKNGDGNAVADFVVKAYASFTTRRILILTQLGPLPLPHLSYTEA